VDELLLEFRSQRDVLLRHFEAIDTKAGILGTDIIVAGGWP